MKFLPPLFVSVSIPLLIMNGICLAQGLQERQKRGRPVIVKPIKVIVPRTSFQELTLSSNLHYMPIHIDDYSRRRRKIVQKPNTMREFTPIGLATSTGPLPMGHSGGVTGGVSKAADAIAHSFRDLFDRTFNTEKMEMMVFMLSQSFGISQEECFDFLETHGHRDINKIMLSLSEKVARGSSAGTSEDASEDDVVVNTSPDSDEEEAYEHHETRQPKNHRHNQRAKKERAKSNGGAVKLTRNEALQFGALGFIVTAVEAFQAIKVANALNQAPIELALKVATTSNKPATRTETKKEGNEHSMSVGVEHERQLRNEERLKRLNQCHRQAHANIQSIRNGNYAKRLSQNIANLIGGSSQLKQFVGDKGADAIAIGSYWLSMAMIETFMHFPETCERLVKVVERIEGGVLGVPNALRAGLEGAVGLAVKGAVGVVKVLGGK